MKKCLLTLLFLLSVFTGLIAQVLVTTEAQNKNVVLEEFTGIHCQYCPDGHRIAQGISDANPGRVVLINIHQGVYANPSAGEPDFRTPFGDAIAGQANISGYPAGTVNRHLFPGNSGTSMSRGSWSAAADQIMAMPSPVNVGIETTYETSTRLLTVTVELYYTGTSAVTSNFINVALLQNNVIGPQTGGGAGNNYVHKHMLRHLLTGQWGDEVTTTSQGSLVTRTYTYTVPAAYNSVPCVIENCQIGVFVAQSHQEILTGDLVNAINGSNRYIGSATVASDFKQGFNAQTCNFSCDLKGALPSGEQYELSFIPIDTVTGWNHSYTVNGVSYTGSTTVALNKDEIKNISLKVTPGTKAAVATYRLIMKSMTYTSAPAKTADVTVISGITTLVVNGSGGPESTTHQDVYLNGLANAGCTTADVISASLMVKGINAGALAGVASIFYNVAWTFPSFKDSEAVALKAFMNSGRHVLVAGQDVGWDIMSAATGSNGNEITRDLYTNFLCAKFIDDGSTANNQLTAVTTDAVYGQAGNSTITDVYAGNMYPDQIDTLSPARPIFLYKNLNSKRAALRVEKNHYRAVYFGVGLEMLSTVAVRNTIIKLTYDWFNALITADEFDSKMSELMGQNYPNPSDSYTIFPLGEINKNMNILLSDITGRQVASYSVKKGDTQLRINTSGLKAGQYICTLHDGNSVVNSKRITIVH